MYLNFIDIQFLFDKILFFIIYLNILCILKNCRSIYYTKFVFHMWGSLINNNTNTRVNDIDYYKNNVITCLLFIMQPMIIKEILTFHQGVINKNQLH